MSKKGKGKAPGEKGKPGNQGDFKGARLEFLNSWIPRYNTMSKNKDGTIKCGGASPMFPELLAAYLAKFPWRLALDVEPPSDLTDLAREPTTPEEVKAKGDIVTAMDAKLHHWFARQRTNLGLVRTVVDKMFVKLIPEEPAADAKEIKRKPTFAQWYMGQAAYKDKVDDAFEKEHPDPLPQQALSLRVAMAGRLLAQEPVDVIDTLREQYTRAYAKGGDGEEEDEIARTKEVVLSNNEGDDDEEGEAGKGFEVLLTEEEKELARKRFSTIAEPLVDRLRKCTGYDIVLLAGKVEGEGTTSKKKKKAAKTVHAMFVQGGEEYKKHPDLDFGSWDEDKHSYLMNLFGKFVYNGHKFKKRLALEESGAIPAGSAAKRRKKNVANSTSLEDGATPPPPPAVVNTSLEGGATPPPPPPVVIASIEGSAAPPPPPPPPVVNTSLEGSTSPPPPHPVVNTSLEGSTSPPPPPPLLTMSLNGSMTAPVPPQAGLQVEGIGPFLAAELALLESEKRQKLIEDFKRLTGVDRKYMEDAVERRAVMAKLGFGAVTSQLGWGPDSQTTGKGKRKATAKGRGKKKKARVEGDENEDGGVGEDVDDAGAEDDEEKEGREDGEEGDQEPEEVVESRADAQRGRPRPRLANKGAGIEGAREAYGQLFAEWGPAWEKLLTLWWRSEFASEFHASRPSHIPQSRPREISEWVARGRKAGYRIPAKDGGATKEDIKALDVRMWKWWVASNPVWRRKTEENGDVSLLQGDDSLREVDLRGKNGFLSVLMGLKMWAEVADGGVNNGEWQKMAADVTWVLERLTVNDPEVPAGSGPNDAPGPAKPAAAEPAVPTAASNDLMDVDGPTILVDALVKPDDVVMEPEGAELDALILEGLDPEERAGILALDPEEQAAILDEMRRERELS
ncbi:hypothetical protein FB45DRAFT_1021778 [Roridomyces roridus]|uniref:Uncharacterized protein n=1 Tax=Roridomyces roridus TaxID=1738132 RepID=A0AAD7B4K3_9AGAR|nr:hypothetical protein FB45DRAFT_1037949 [Roridomyces roridus]KAJ7640995.1 hypothetical protein FB45DRAFT_1021778 [Roridomyces roridus]